MGVLLHEMRQFFKTFLLGYNCFTMLCQFLLYNKVNRLYAYIYPHILPPCILPPSLSHPSRWSQSTELISLCYTAASHQLSILHLVVYICQCYSLISSQFTLPLPVSSSPFSTSVSLFLSCPQVDQNLFFFWIPYICVSILYLFFSF